MIKTCIHIGDIHIRTLRLHDEYKEVFLNLFKDLKDNLKDFKREEIRIVVTGDLVHQKIIISNEQLILGTWFLKKLEEIAPVILIAGNHDMLENNKDRMDSVTPMVRFLPDGVNVNYFKESKCYLDDNIVWCVYSIFEGNKRPDIESARKEFGDDKTYIGLFHGPIVGAKTDIGYTIDHGAQLEIFDGNDIVMCGDIHMRQKFMYGNTPIVMPSSLIQQNFGETVSGHGFLLWDVQTRTYKEFDVHNDYQLYHFKINSLNDLDNGTEILVNL